VAKIGAWSALLFTGPASSSSATRGHPSIVADGERTFRVLKELSVDIFLAQHPNMFDMEKKVGRMNAGGNPFVDPQGTNRRRTLFFRHSCSASATAA
jgi:hypothetical protein